LSAFSLVNSFYTPVSRTLDIMRLSSFRVQVFCSEKVLQQAIVPKWRLHFLK
jgi:hypothetical protein